MNYYYDMEYGMTFTAAQPGSTFTRWGGGREYFPINGTAYLLFGLGQSLAGSMRVQNYVPQFGLYSVDLAEFSDYYPYPHTVQFFGYRADGSVVSTSFTTDGIIDGTGPLADFQTFYFDESFAAIVRFEIPDYCYGYALDNLTLFRVVPEPSTGALLLGGGLVVWAVRSRRR